jgi:hypothetical protein
LDLTQYIFEPIGAKASIVAALDIQYNHLTHNMLAKFRVASIVILLLMCISSAIVGIKFAFYFVANDSLGTRGTRGYSGVDDLINRTDVATVVRDVYDVLILIIKPLFVLVLVCQFSPQVNGKISSLKSVICAVVLYTDRVDVLLSFAEIVSQCIPLWVAEELYGSAESESCTDGVSGLSATIPLSGDIPPLEPNPNDSRATTEETEYVFDEIYGRIPVSVYDQWKRDEAKTKDSICQKVAAYNRTSVKGKNGASRNQFPVRSFQKTS